MEATSNFSKRAKEAFEILSSSNSYFLIYQEHEFKCYRTSYILLKDGKECKGYGEATFKELKPLLKINRFISYGNSTYFELVKE